MGRGWLFHKYDALGRTILTGMYNGDKGSSDNENVRADNMQSRWQNQLSRESRDDSQTCGYTWNTFPTDPGSVTVTQVNYYDDYSYANSGLSQLDYQAKTGYDAQHPSAKGLLTGTRSRLLTAGAGGNEWITAVYYYDYKGNVVQKRATNQLGGYDCEYYVYGYNSQVKKKYIEHSSTYQSSVTEEYEYSYDAQLRLTGVTHSLNGASPVSLAGYTYNNLGQVETQATGGLETATYAYNIRGWETSRTGSRFSESLYYTNSPKSGGQAYYGGNVAVLTWKSPANNSTLKGYSFEYDALGRLQAAQYGEGGSLSANTQRYDEAFTYDKHGNPLTIKRYGRRDLYGDGSYGLIDDLTMPPYTGNYLLEVADAAGDLSHSDLMEFKDGINNPGEEYIHNCFGGLTSDYNRKICYMRYNYLALPQSVQFRYGHRIEYAYDAGGMKRTVRYREASHDMGYWPWDDRVPAESDFLPSPLTKQYTGNKVYENNGLKLILTENGYIEKTGGTYTRYYYLKDRLGNNRIVMNASGSVVQMTNYYPSGTVMAELPARTDQGVQPYKFGDKELDRSNGLDFYDFVWRQYDPTLMRFTTPDPLAEKYYAISPYVYCANNPVRYVDPTGMDIWEINNTGEIIKRVKDKTQDAFFMVAKDAEGSYQRTFTTDAEGNKNYNSISFKYGTVESQRTTSLNSTDSYDTYKVRGDVNGTQMFEFMSQNTTVEWSQAKAGIEGDRGLNFITTSHDKTKESGMTNLINGQLVYGYTMREFNHSHPKDGEYNYIPSGIPGLTGNHGDVPWSRQVSKIFGNQVNYKIYTPNTRRYHPFGPNSQKSDYIE
jgi:RHS repeat-associated protein